MALPLQPRGARSWQWLAQALLLQALLLQALLLQALLLQALQLPPQQ